MNEALLTPLPYYTLTIGWAPGKPGQVRHRPAEETDLLYTGHPIARAPSLDTVQMDPS